MKKITGQVIYLGPQLPHLGLGYATIFRNGIHPALYPAIEECKALGELFIPVRQAAVVRRELNFDIARQVRGAGKHVTFYREVEKWRRAKHNRTQEPTPSGITLEKHHA